MIELLRRLLRLPGEVDNLRKDLARHMETDNGLAHNAPFWVEYNLRQREKYDRCKICGYMWAKGGPELHFNDTDGDHCPNYKEHT